MLKITSIKKGIVIDHIKAGKGIKIYHLLNLGEADYTVALINNVKSAKMGRKDLIKIENTIDINLGILGLFGDEITINIIDKEKISQKLKIYLPETIEGVLQCANPRCISQHERNIQSVFHLINKEDKQYMCEYCHNLYETERLNHVNY